MPPRSAVGPVPPWAVTRTVRDSLFDPPRKRVGALSSRRARWTPERRGFCRHCKRPKFSGADHCGRRSCRGYLDLWLTDQRMRLWANLLEYGGAVGMTTLSGPGADRLPWDPSACRHRPGVKCSGKIGCRVVESDAERWNASADRRWSLLHDAAAAAVRRKHGPGALRLLGYSCELQERGILHWHVLVGMESPREKAAAHHYVNNLHRLATSYGYGPNVDRKLRPKPAWSAAQYASKYLVKERSAGGIGELVASGNAPRRPVYVATSLTRETRCTMRNLRLKRAAWARWGVECCHREAESLWAIARVLGDFTMEPVDVVAGGSVAQGP